MNNNISYNAPFLFGEECVLSRELSLLCTLLRGEVPLLLTTPPSPTPSSEERALDEMEARNLSLVRDTERLGVLGALPSLPEFTVLEEAVFLTFLTLRRVL